MKVVFDTNIYFHDFLLDSPEFRTLFSESPRLGYVLCVPKIVFDETVTKYSEESKKLFDIAERLGVLELRFSKNAAITLSPDNVKGTYQEYFSKTMRTIQSEIIDYPKISHQELVERALQRRKPFRSSDTGGYRDALIWATILEIAKTDEVTFISCIPNYHTVHSTREMQF